MKNNSLRLVFALMIFLPPLLVQSIFPLISQDKWRSISEWAYQNLSLVRDVKKRNNMPSGVAVVKISPATHHHFKKQFSRDHLNIYLKKMNQADRPWIISLLTQTEIPSRPEQDAEFIRLLQGYGRYVGTSITIANDLDLKDPFKITQAPSFRRSFFNRSGQPPASLPFLPLQLLEKEDFITSQAVTGLYPSVAAEGMGTCMHPYFADEGESFVIPTSFLWVSALATKSRLKTEEAKWPPESEAKNREWRGWLDVTATICLSSPQESTKDYLTRRNILVLEFSDVIEDKIKDVFGKKISMAKLLEGRVLLLTSEKDKVRDPFGPDSEVNNFVYPHEIEARYLDSLLNKTFLKKPRAISLKETRYLPLILAFVFAAGALIVPFVQIFYLSLVILLFLIFVVLYRLNIDMIFLIPTRALFAAALSSLLIYTFLFYIRRKTDFRLKRFSRNLRAKLSQCNTLEQLRIGTQNVCRSEFKLFTLIFKDFDLDLHQAAGDPELAFQYLVKIGLRQDDLDRILTERESRSGHSPELHMIQNSLSRASSTVFNQLRQRSFATALAVANDFKRLGTIDLALKYEPYEEDLVIAIVNVMQQELSLNWARIEDNVKIKLREFHKLVEKSSLKTIQYFLPTSILYRFSQNRSLEDNIKSTLAPRLSKTALLQARFVKYDESIVTDVFQKISDVLYEYYELPLFEASQVAQVKMLGDRIWFIVDEIMAANLEVSCSDLILFLTCVFRKEAEKHNHLKENRPRIELEFIAHYGVATLGNLLNQKRIDYSLSGKPCHVIENLESLRNMKVEAFQALHETMILTKDFIADLKVYQNLEFKAVSLVGLEQDNRWQEIETVHYLPLETVFKIAESTTIRDLTRRS